MRTSVAEIIDQLDELEDRLQDALHQRSEEIAFRLQHGKVVFEREFRLKNRALRTGIIKYIAESRLRVLLTAPVIYSLIVPFVLMDIFVTVYQAICFPVYQVSKVRRGDYLVFDRVKLDYLNGIEKFNCAYCSYCNGIIAYVREVAARTEQYWCPIKHAQKQQGTHGRYPRFTDFGDGEQFRRELDKIKKELSNL